VPHRPTHPPELRARVDGDVLANADVADADGARPIVSRGVATT
jgi:hypothetical protein